MKIQQGQAADLFVEEQFEYALYLYTKTINSEESEVTEKVQAYLKRGKCYSEMHKFQDAIKDLESAIQLDRYNESAYRRLAEIYLIEGNFVAAKQSIINLLTILGDDKEIEKDIARKTKKDYEDIEILELRAKDAFKKNDYQQVVYLMDECLQKSQICLRHKIQKARCLIYLRNFNASLYELNDILFTNKDEIEAIFLRGLNMIYQQKYHTGIEDIKYTLHEQFGGNSNECRNTYDIYKNIEKYLFKAENLKPTAPEEAKEIYKQILNSDAKNLIQKKDMYIKIATIEYEQNKFNEALISITNALIIEENNVTALRLRAQISTKLKEFKDAIDDYNKIVRLENTKEHVEWLKRAKDLLINNKIDHYSMLGLTKSASNSDLKKAFKKLALNYHPDKLGRRSKAEQIIGHRKYIRIEESYKILVGET